jgi:ATP-dependent 26S proteasome regulatory subunit
MQQRRMPPALVVLEDLDRLFLKSTERGKGPKVTLQHLLNCLDGLGTQDGIIVVATANDTSSLDPSILKRPGRFDRVVPFSKPDERLCAEYLDRLSRSAFNGESPASIVAEAVGLSFAQLRESYILAGQCAYDHSDVDYGLRHEADDLDHLRRSKSCQVRC